MLICMNTTRHMATILESIRHFNSEHWCFLLQSHGEITFGEGWELD